MAADFIYLSPHLDDAVLSCGGQITQQVRRGRRVLVVTVCAGDPPVPAADSAFVRELYTRWALNNPTAARRAEDLDALRTLRAEALHLDAPDGIYRVDRRTGRPLYPDRDAIFGALSDQDSVLVDEVARQLSRLEPLWGARVYAPLGVGHHVDHLLTRSAAERWAAPGGHLVYYEEYPYAEEQGGVEAALAGRRLTPERVELARKDVERKIAAVACYRSQLSSFFTDPAEMAQRLWAFARQAGGLAERVWRAP